MSGTSRVMTLERYCYADDFTIGRLYGPGFCLATIERPWRGNQPWISCIPEGRYPCVLRRFNRGGYNTLEIRDVRDRSEILFHVANYARDVQGCVGLGLDVSWAMPGVASSREAMGRFRDGWGIQPDEQFVVGGEAPVCEVVIGQIAGGRLNYADT